MARHILSLGLAFGAGALATLAFAPFSWWWCAPLSLALWMGLSMERRGFLTGYLYGLGLFLTGVSWISVSMIEHGGASLQLGWLMTAAFACGLAIFPGLASAGFARWHGRWPGLFGQIVLLSALWVTMEALRSWLLTGFPWLLIGYSALDSPFEGYLSWLGTYGTSAIIALSAGAGLILWRSRQLQWVLLPVALCAGGLGLNQFFTPTLASTPVTVALWQPMIVQAEKWQPEYREAIVANHIRRGLPTNASLLVWPETAMPMTDTDAVALLPDLDALLIRDRQTLITGILGRHQGRYTNRLTTFGIGEGVYDKTRLVPFGEYVPLEAWLRGLIAFFDLPMSAIVPGVKQDLLVHETLIMAPLICYEIAYSGLARRHAREANAILTVSNDTWFGDSIGPDQHLQIARIRARELGKPVIRATNDGWTAFIDARGQVQSALPRFADDVLIDTVVPATTVTPYASAGEAPLVLLLVILLTLTRRNGAKVAK